MPNRIYNTPEELESETERYFTDCEINDSFPDRADMIIYLGIPLDTYNTYESNEGGKYEGFAEVLRKAQLRREGWLSRAMFVGKSATSAMFHLKQTCNGGYMEKPAQESPKLELDIKINGESTNQFD